MWTLRAQRNLVSVVHVDLGLGRGLSHVQAWGARSLGTHSHQPLPEKKEEKHKVPWPLSAVPSDSVTAQRKVSDSRPCQSLGSRSAQEPYRTWDGSGGGQQTKNGGVRSGGIDVSDGVASCAKVRPFVDLGKGLARVLLPRVSLELGYMRTWLIQQVSMPAPFYLSVLEAQVLDCLGIFLGWWVW